MNARNTSRATILRPIPGDDSAAQCNPMQTAMERLGGANCAQHTESGVFHPAGMHL
jgi:hypothetical protein